ncbi:MAG: hypothetical protein IPN82_13885 [Chitinophagaceae bacterium]|nr:hypothetical protein [Chitinophagaceae bacterium]MBK8607837.1 hypothetical protein [Chitinophagaceae bacterium]MBP6476697.1 hypothetical protein [Chitinophagaceae bacterium]MBP7107673.1 hypothetical protein [Chitinophagaceae bacterium]MBP7314338.1 hypothetical protein [Chitinophagaceae bacterium]
MEKDKFKIAFTETILNTFPEILKQDVEKVIEILSFDKDYLFSPDSQTIYIDNEIINIPCRIYIDEPDPVKEKSLTEQQKIMLNCLFLRHHNGYIRQSRLELLIDKTENYITPFIFQLLGEYVIEILFVLDKHINDKTIDNYLKLINDNEKYWHQTKSRVISYWNVYYRRPHYHSNLPSKYKNRKDYIGQQIIERLNNANLQQRGSTSEFGNE